MPTCRMLALGSLLALAVIAALPGKSISATQPQPGAISYWGMNVYLAKSTATAASP